MWLYYLYNENVYIRKIQFRLYLYLHPLNIVLAGISQSGFYGILAPWVLIAVI